MLKSTGILAVDVMKRKTIYGLIVGASFLVAPSSFLLKNYVEKLDEPIINVVLLGTDATSLLGIAYGTKKLEDLSKENQTQSKLEGELTN